MISPFFLLSSNCRHASPCPDNAPTIPEHSHTRSTIPDVRPHAPTMPGHSLLIRHRAAPPTTLLVPHPPPVMSVPVYRLDPDTIPDFPDAPCTNIYRELLTLHSASGT